MVATVGKVNPKTFGGTKLLFLVQREVVVSQKLITEDNRGYDVSINFCR